MGAIGLLLGKVDLIFMPTGFIGKNVKGRRWICQFL